MNKLINTMLMVLVIASCGSPKENALKEIDQLEKQDSLFDAATLQARKDAYLQFAEKYPDDEHSPDFLFKAAQNLGALAQETGDSSLHRQSIVLFERITTTYPQHPLAEDALLLKGFVLENHLKDISAAKAAYQEVIAKYPTGELAEEAKLSIENLGVEPAEIVKKFQSDTIK